eukprot:3443532-Pleurochrysis_carterae.AAC.4
MHELLKVAIVLEVTVRKMRKMSEGNLICRAISTTGMALMDGKSNDGYRLCLCIIVHVSIK